MRASVYYDIVLRHSYFVDRLSENSIACADSTVKLLIISIICRRKIMPNEACALSGCIVYVSMSKEFANASNCDSPMNGVECTNVVNRAVFSDYLQKKY